jgi:hypothetical protein
VVFAKRASISPVSPRSTFHSTNELKIQEDHRRSEMKKILATMALLTVIATPTFAQSFNAQEGTGNELPFSYKSTAHDTQSIARANGENAFAAAPGEKTTNDPYSPANTGGGSDGYNWSVAHDY